MKKIIKNHGFGNDSGLGKGFKVSSLKGKTMDEKTQEKERRWEKCWKWKKRGRSGRGGAHSNVVPYSLALENVLFENKI